jgi:hypothetical protein
MKKILVLIVLITSFVSPLDTTHPTMKTLIQQPSKILTDFQGEHASSTNNILYGKGILYGKDIFDGRDARYSIGTFKFDSPTLIAHNKIYKLKMINENSFEIIR